MTNVLSGIFGSSPVMAIEEHADVVHKCARKLVDFFAAVSESDWKTAESVRDNIAELENKADAIKNEVRTNLPRSLFMPVPRQDILELLVVQDKIANRAKDVAGIVVGRRLEIPDAISDELAQFVARCVDSTKQARKSIRELDELFTTGFRGAEADLVAGMIQKLDEIETDMDSREVSLRAGLFKVESDLNPVDVMFLYQTIGKIGEIADMAERVGRRLELLLSH